MWAHYVSAFPPSPSISRMAAPASVTHHSRVPSRWSISPVPQNAIRALRFPTCMVPSCPSNSPPSPGNTKSTSKIQVMDISPNNIVLGLEKASSVRSDELASKLKAAAPTARLINVPRSSHESSDLICIALDLGSKVSAPSPGSRHVIPP